MIFDALIIGGGVSGMQCALVLGSANNKPFAQHKRIGIVMHQRASHLETALFNNVLGLQPNSLGKDILIQGKEQLKNLYPNVNQIENEKVISIEQVDETYHIKTNKNQYQSFIVVIALNYAKPFTIDVTRPKKRLHNFKHYVQKRQSNQTLQ